MTTEKTLAKFALISAVVGLLPFPIIDLLLLSVVNFLMFRRLAQNLAVPFRNIVGRTLVASLGGGALSVKMMHGGAIGYVLKSIPAIGTYVGWMAQPVLAGAITYALGQIFTWYLISKKSESGAN